MISLHVKILVYWSIAILDSIGFLLNSLNKSDLNKRKFNLKLLNEYLDYNNYDNG